MKTHLLNEEEDTQTRCGLLLMGFRSIELVDAAPTCKNCQRSAK